MVNELLGIQYNTAKANVTDRKVQNLASYINADSLKAILVEADSVYMELCREDYYRDYENNDTINSKSSFELMQKGQQNVIFYDLFMLMLDLLELEYQYVSYAAEHNTIDIYTNYFGADIIFKRFYRGIWRSIDYSGCTKDAFAGVVKNICDKFDLINQNLTSRD